MPPTAGGSIVTRVGVAIAALAGALLLTAPSAASAEPVNTSPPVISGVLEAGQTLTATTGTWTDSGATITSYDYQWMLCQGDCTFIDYGDFPTFPLTDADIGEQIAVLVTAYDSAGNSTYANSEATFVIGPNYNTPSYTLSESAVGNGSVTGFATVPEVGRTADANLSCPGICGASYSYPPGTEIELIATPAAGSTFLGWGGACSGSAPTCSLAMSGDEEGVATFSGQTTTNPLLPLRHEDEAGGAQPPASGAPSLGAWEAPPPSARSLPARLTSIHYRRRHVQAEVKCEETGPCHLSLAIFTGAQAITGQHSFAVAAGRSARIALTLSRQGQRLLDRRHRLPVTAHLTLSASGHSVLVEQRRFTLTA